jgi:hypothetical protein
VGRKALRIRHTNGTEMRKKRPRGVQEEVPGGSRRGPGGSSEPLNPLSVSPRTAPRRWPRRRRRLPRWRRRLRRRAGGGGHFSFPRALSGEKRRQAGPEVGPTSAFLSCVPAGVHGPTCTFWADLTPLSRFCSDLNGELHELHEELHARQCDKWSLPAVKESAVQAVDCPGRKPPCFFLRISARRAHTTPPYKNDLLRRTLTALNRPGVARTVIVYATMTLPLVMPVTATSAALTPPIAAATAALAQGSVALSRCATAPSPALYRIRYGNRCHFFRVCTHTNTAVCVQVELLLYTAVCTGTQLCV